MGPDLYSLFLFIDQRIDIYRLRSSSYPSQAATIFSAFAPAPRSIPVLHPKFLRFSFFFHLQSILILQINLFILISKDGDEMEGESAADGGADADADKMAS